jgi:hypothetical protein
MQKMNQAVFGGSVDRAEKRPSGKRREPYVSPAAPLVQRSYVPLTTF